MKALGIVQDGDPVLRRPARSFALPSEAEDARRVIFELQSTIYRDAKAHTFSKGMGIAAPQTGIARYEGCLSFFDVRCLVPRPLVIHVEHQDITGDRRIHHL